MALQRYPSKIDTASNVVFKVTDSATSYDWIAISQEATGCDYMVQIHSFTIACEEPSGNKYQCYQGTCKPATFGVAKDVCDAICH